MHSQGEMVLKVIYKTAHGPYSSSVLCGIVMR